MSPARYNVTGGSGAVAPGGANYKALVTGGIALIPIQSGTPALPVLGVGVALDASRISLVTAETVGVTLSTVTTQTPALPVLGAGVALSAVATYAASAHRLGPGLAVTRIQFDLTARRGGAVVVTSTGWATPANAIDGTDGRANGTSATSTGSALGNTNTLVLSYPAQTARNNLIISSVKLYFYAATSLTWLVSTAAISYSLDGGATFTALGNIPAGAVLGTPQVFDITAAVGGAWSKIAALQTRVIVTHAAASALEVLTLDAIEDEAIAARTDVLAVTAPGAPTGVTASGGNTQATVSWTAPYNDGNSPITNYRVTPYIAAVAQTATTVGNVLTTTITGLTNGTAYTFKVAAINAIGTGADSAASGAVTPSASFDPNSIAGLVAWYKAATIAQADASAVSTWADSATTPHNLTQATTAKQPTYRTNVINGLPVVRCDSSTTQGMASSAVTIAQPNTTFVVGKVRVVPASGTNYYFVDGTANATAILAANTQYGIYAGTAVIGAGVSDTAFHTLVAVENSPSSKIRVDGGAGTGGNAGTGSYSLVNVGASSTTFDGDIAEVLIYNTALSLTNINSVGNYLATKYALTWTTAT